MRAAARHQILVYLRPVGPAPPDRRSEIPAETGTHEHLFECPPTGHTCREPVIGRVLIRKRGCITRLPQREQGRKS